MARKDRELQKKIRIQMPSTVPVPDPARVTRRPRAYAGRTEGGDESTANTRFDLTSIIGGNIRSDPIRR